MANFILWAPEARRIDLKLNLPGGNEPRERVLAMEPGPNDYWCLDVPEAGPGTEYAFLVDGEGPFPDPRSSYQPHGVHGPSRLVDHHAFAWSDQHHQARPLPSAVIYELHIGTFTPDGTFDAAILKLDHLVELGITHIELMPVCEFAGDYGWGYDGVDLYAPHHAYGGPDGLKRLVDACHARGLGVILDVIYNHLGPAGNYLEKFGPYHSDRYTTAWGAAMNFDGPGSDEVRRFFIDNALMWLRDYHMDGLRLDAVHAFIDNGAYHFLEELKDEVFQLSIELGRHLVLVAESDLNDPRLVQSSEIGGYGLDAVWSDDFHHALHVLLTGEHSGYYEDYNGWQDLPAALTQVFVYGGLFTPRRGHRHGRPVGSLPGYRFLGYIQNHDQIGNRALGERIGQLIGEDLAKVAAALVLTGPFVPMLFMGEEWGASTPFQYFTNHEPELGRLVSEGRRSEFGAFGWEPEQVPDPQEKATFLRSKLNWAECKALTHAELFDWHRQLIALRRDCAALSNGRLDKVSVTMNREEGWLILVRAPQVKDKPGCGPMAINGPQTSVDSACSFVIAANIFDQDVLIDYETTGAETIRLASNPQAALTERGILLPARSVIIFSVEAVR